MREGASRFGWERRVAKPASVRDGPWLVGLGVASAIRGDLLKNASARARLESDGRLTVELAMTDLGTGSYTILTQIAAEAMELPDQPLPRTGHASDSCVRHDVPPRMSLLLSCGVRRPPGPGEDIRSSRSTGRCDSSSAPAS